MEVAEKINVWKLDTNHSDVQFNVRHLVISTVTGKFKRIEGTVEAASKSFEDAQVSILIDVNSIDTHNSVRDKHLLSPDFFDAVKYPFMRFKSQFFRQTSDGRFKLVGELTIKDVTRLIELDVTYGGTAIDMSGNPRAGFEVTGKLNRKDFGLTWNGVTEAGAMIVSDEVKLVINVQLASV